MGDDLWCVEDNSYCLEETRWLPRNDRRDPDRLMFRFRTYQACPSGWYTEVRLEGTPHMSSNTKQYPVRAGETLTVWFECAPTIFPAFRGPSGVALAAGSGGDGILPLRS